MEALRKPNEREVAMNLTDRRGAKDRRSTNFGPPSGQDERRLNMERRIFDVGSFAAEARFPFGNGRRTIIREGLRASLPDEQAVAA